MPHVLAVEDSRTQAEALRAVLEADGFEVTLARDGREALQLLGGGGFDLVVSDVMMPGMTGYDLCRAVKGDPATADLPVVLLTSLTDPLDVVSGLESGADNFLRKPYEAAQLTGRLRAALRNRRIRDDHTAESGIRLSFLDREFEINAGRTQMLDLLVSTFEELVSTSRTVLAREQDLREAHEALESQLQAVDLERTRLRAVVGSVPVPLFVMTVDGRVSYASEAGAAALGTSTAAVRGRLMDDLVTFVDGNGDPIPAADLPHHQAPATRGSATLGGSFDVFLLAPGGERLPVLLEASAVLDDRGEPAGCVSTMHVLGALTQHDPTTGLPNSVAFLEHVAGVLAAPRGDTAVLLLALDRYEVVGAMHGTEVATEVLVEVARRLGEVFEPTHGAASPADCFLAYLGGHRFGVVLARLPDSFSVLHMAESARRAVAADQPGYDVRLTASIGVALGSAGHEAPQLLAAAGVALSRAGEAGGDRVELFGHSASQEAMARLRLEAELRTAVEQGLIELHYQPETDLATGRLIGFEALARWTHPVDGPVSPEVFIALAEASGSIRALGEHVLRTACREARTWAPIADAPSVAVNVSALQLVPGFVDEVVAVLEDTGLEPGRLVLELTETATMADPDATLPLLDRLRSLGVRISLDDFGTGYSSLGLLSRMELDQLKLDRGFVAGIERHGRESVVARSVIALGASLDVNVLAEGIETQRQADLLRRLGCTQGQGYHLGRPMPASAVPEFLAGLVGQDGLVVER